MIIPPTPFPWWLWLLAALWAGSLVLWQRGVLPRDWQRGLAVVIAVYTALLIGAATVGSPWTFSRGMFWLAGGLAIGSGLGLMRQTTVGGRRLAVWGVVCGVAGLLVQLGAEVSAGMILLIGGVLVARLRGAAADSPTAIPHRDAWLIGAMATLVVVAWIGSVRHALMVEMQRPIPSQRVTALPTREHVRRWLITEPGHDSKQSATRSATPQWEWVALTGALVCIVIVARRRDSQDKGRA